MFLLDTNVISELRRVKPHGAVIAWLQAADDSHLYIGAPSIGEIQAGVEITREQDSGKATEIEEWLESVAETFNILPMDGRAFRFFARLMHKRSESLIEDAMIAAIAQAHDLIVVTRNIRHFAPFGVRTLDPFKPIAQ